MTSFSRLPTPMGLLIDRDQPGADAAGMGQAPREA